MSYRTYHELTGEDRSALAGQVAEQRQRVAERLSSVKNTVAIMSGKGGVGKSYVTAALSLELRRRLSGSIGVLDADLNGPTAVSMLGASGRVRITEDGVEPVAGRDGVLVMSSGLLLDDGQPLRWRGPNSEQFVWRGTLEIGTLREFLGDVKWGSLEALLIDLPPGSGSIADLANLVPHLTGALAVTIPSVESEHSVERTVRVAVEQGIRLLGIVENMSSYLCSSCGEMGPLFDGSAGRRLADKFGVPLLARLPFQTKQDGPEPTPEVAGLTDAVVEMLQ